MKKIFKNPFEVYSSVDKNEKRRPLDWEESAVDSSSYIEEIYDNERPAKNIRWLWLALILVFCMIGLRLFYLQILRGKDFRSLSENNRVRQQVILAPRGLIKDRNGEILVQNQASFNLVAVPFDLPKDGLSGEIVSLAKAFNLTMEEISAKIGSVDKNSIDPVVIKQDMTQQESILFDTRASEFAGFYVQQIPIRDYIDGPAFSHVIGYTGLVGPKDLQGLDESLYDMIDYIGKSGVETSYEKYLHGSNGQKMVEVDATGKLLDVLGENSPTPGDTLQLNIDKGLQERLYKDLSTGNKKAAAVAMDPRNGQILALVSLPGFDNNLFAHGIKSDDYLGLLNDKNLPLFNRAIAGTYPPGSTVKPMVASAALQEGVVTPETIIYDNGVLVIPNQFDPRMNYNFYGWKLTGLGPMTVKSAIALSSDIYFYVVSGGYPKSAVKTGLGAEKLADYYRKFNLGQPTGIDLQGEKSGLVPDPEWKARYFKDDAILSKWYLGDTYHIGIGQGDLLVTPLQVSEWISVIANNGVGYKPQVVNKIINNDGQIEFVNQPQILIKDFLSPEILKTVQEGMRQTITSGTGRQLNDLLITSAGKTGTSQFDGSDPKRTHAWFTAYAPYENPQIVITVLVEAGGEGNVASVPVVKDALKWWAENRYKK